jgi:valyl-tRNA synthetase
MVHVLDTCLRLLHPYMPFMTEEAWRYIPHEGEALIMAKWPEVNPAYQDEAIEAQMDILIELVRGVRNIRTEYRVDPAKRIKALAAPGSHRANLEKYGYVFARLCNVHHLELLPDHAPAPKNAASAVVSDATLYLPLEGMLDVAAESDRLQKEKTGLLERISKVEQKLNNESFTAKAPPAVVQRERDSGACIYPVQARLERVLVKMVRPAFCASLRTSPSLSVV